ncbi:olfactory receptor 1496-like [Bombina bombina]|uniref:olfactory receptor 1496-like n=1 Tax=Bombina bombina TaxID=8345 RepID=UPI00235A8DA4|nr:olfactory receptor 1496-like [Bombina bombina]
MVISQPSFLGKAGHGHKISKCGKRRCVMCSYISHQVSTFTSHSNGETYNIKTFNPDLPLQFRATSERSTLFINRVSSFVHGGRLKTKDEIMLDSPDFSLTWFTYLQIGHFINTHKYKLQLVRDPSPFESLCIQSNVAGHLVSLIYTLLLKLRDSPLPNYTRAWHKELGSELSNEDWQRIFRAVKTLSVSARMQESHYKFLSRWYLTPSRLKTIYPRASEKCWRGWGGTDKNTSETMKNHTVLAEFYLETFNLSTKGQLVVFVGTLLMYLLAVLGNVTIVTLVSLVSQLQTPMYLFLCSLSVQDIMFVSAILPKLLAITITGDTSITFSGCITQIFLFVFCIDTEFFLLTSMAYDRYVAICIPLHYPLIMSKTVCVLLITVCWFVGLLNASAYFLILSNLTFCKKVINNFFCDVIILLKLSCSDITYIINLFIPLEGTIIGLLPFILIMISYIYIIATILKIRSSSGRLKTFSSCSSHLTVVVLLYGTSISLNMKPKSENSLEIDKLLSMIYTGVVPMVNPLVYSLRNKDVLKAMKNSLKKIK